MSNKISSDSDLIKPFRLGELKKEGSNHSHDSTGFIPLKFDIEIPENEIRANREHESTSGFSISDVVREHRGLARQEERDFEDRVEKQVILRLEQIKSAAYEEGFQSGSNKGHEKAYSESLVLLDEKIENFATVSQDLEKQAHSILSQNKDESFRMIKNLTKWILLKEVEDESYLERLLEKLIYEINTKSNLVVKVSQKSFKYMPEIIKRIEARMGSLENIRIKVDPIQDSPGIILESENGIIDGSINSQMESLDKIFEAVGVHESDA
jgi:flagellar assembly protein FliH